MTGSSSGAASDILTAISYFIFPVTLTFGPVAALALRSYAQMSAARPKQFFRFSLSIFILFLLNIKFFKIFTVSHTLNFDLFFVWCLSFYYLWAHLLRIRTHWLLWVVKALTSIIVCIPMLVCTIGLILGFGFFVVMVIVHDQTEPRESMSMGRNLVCETNLWGMVGSGGETVTLYRRWPLIPFLEHELASDSKSDGAEMEDLKSCDQLAATVK